MPFVDAQPELGKRRMLDEPEITPEIATLDTFNAAFALHNSVGSLVDRGKRPDFSLTPLSPELRLGADEYDSLDDLIGYEQYADRFVEVDSQAESEWIKGNIDRELEHRENLENSGGMGIAAMVAAGITEPILAPLLPIGGGFLTTARTATVAGVRLAGAVGAGVAVQEAALHPTQETRTVEESIINVSAAALLSGVMGGAIKMMDSKSIVSATKSVQGDLKVPTPDSVGARAAHDTTMEQEQLIKAAGMEKAGLSPDVRLSNSASLKARHIKDDLVESSLRKEKNLEGLASGPEGGSVETNIKMYDRVLGQSINHIDDAYLKYRQGQAGLAASAKTKVGDLFGARRRAGKLTAREFREEVGKAMVRGDVHAIPEIQSVAKNLRKVVDVIKDKAIRLGLLPENVKVATAASYLTRVWKPEIVAANRVRLNETISSWMVNKTPELDLAEAKGMADDAINNILGHPEGKIPLDIVSKAGPLHERTLLIPDEMIEEYLEKDVEVVMRQYIRTMAPDIEIAERFGSKDMKDQIASISNEYDNLIGKLKPGDAKGALKLSAAKKADIRDVEAVRDILSGVYGRPEDASGIIYRTSTGLRKVNFLSKLGGMTVSAMPDMANSVFAHGLKPVSKSLLAMVKSPAGFKKLTKQVKNDMAVGWDMTLNGRAQSIADIGDSAGRHSAVERLLQSESNRFGALSLMAPWNAAMKQFAGVTSTNETVRIAAKWTAGKTPNRHEMLTLTNSGIDEGLAKRISGQFAKFGEQEGVSIPNTSQWTDRGAAKAFNASILKQADEIIVTPGAADRPLTIQGTEAGRQIGQFKSFMFAATNKMMIARMQQRDLEALNGAMLSVALGSMVYASKETLAGREVTDDYGVLIKESVDRSGMLTWIMESNNIIEKLSEGKVGLGAALGESQSARYFSRNKVGALLGPSFGTAKDALDVLGAGISGDIGDSELHSLRKMMPYQNLFYLRGLLDTIEESNPAALATAGVVAGLVLTKGAQAAKLLKGRAKTYPAPTAAQKAAAKAEKAVKAKSPSKGKVIKETVMVDGEEVVIEGTKDQLLEIMDELLTDADELLQ